MFENLNDKLLDIFPFLLISVPVVLFTSLFIYTVFYDFKGDRENLAKCGDEYRECVKVGSGCLTKFNACRGGFRTSREEWARVMGDVQTLNAITSENNARSAATSGALVGGMIGSSIGRR